MKSNTSDPNNNRKLFLPFALIFIVGLSALFFSMTSAAQNTNSRYSVVTNANTAPEVPKATVRGRIIYEDTGRAVRRASFSILGFKAGQPKSGLTDDNGEFVLKDVSAGRYYVSINSPGMLNVLSFVDFSAETAEEAQSTSLENINKNFEEIVVPEGGEIQVVVRAKRGGAIGGRVFYSDGAPAINVKVEVMRKMSEKYVGVVSNFADASHYGRGEMGGAKTDDRGVYRISGLPPGDYIVKVTEPSLHNGKADSSEYGFNTSYSLISVYHPETFSSDEAQTVALEMAQEIEGINITIPERQLFNINGKIVAKGTQQSLRNARVSLKAKSKAISANERMIGEGGGFYSGENGDFEFKDVPSGVYTIKVTPPSTSDYEYDEDGNPKPSRTPKPKYAPLEKEITITDGSLSNLQLELALGGNISGSVSSDAPNRELPSIVSIIAVDEKGATVSSAYVYSYRKENQPPTNAPFSIDNVPKGKFTLRVEPGNYGGPQSAKDDRIFYAKSVKLAGKDYQSAPLEVAEGQAVSKLEIVIGTDGGRLIGKVKNKENEPSVSKRIVLIPTEQSKWNTKSLRRFAAINSDGQFDVEGAPLEYFVIFLAEKDKLSAIDEAWIRERTVGAEKVTIKAGGETTLNLTAP